MMSKYHLLLPEMCWTMPPGDLEWKLRYAPETITREEQLVLAGVIHSYNSLIIATQKKRNYIVREMRKELKDVREN